MDKTAQRQWFVRVAERFLGTPYIWGGDDPSGFDCSGFVLECMKSIGMVREKQDFTADDLHRMLKCKNTDEPKAGVLMFWFTENWQRAYHVAICLDENIYIGASGGDSTTDSPDDAWKQNAYIKIRPIPPHRVTDRVRLIDPFK